MNFHGPLWIFTDRGERRYERLLHGGFGFAEGHSVTQPVPRTVEKTCNHVELKNLTADSTDLTKQITVWKDSDST